MTNLGEPPIPLSEKISHVWIVSVIKKKKKAIWNAPGKDLPGPVTTSTMTNGSDPHPHSS